MARQSTAQFKRWMWERIKAQGDGWLLTSYPRQDANSEPPQTPQAVQDYLLWKAQWIGPTEQPASTAEIALAWVAWYGARQEVDDERTTSRPWLREDW